MYVDICMYIYIYIYVCPYVCIFMNVFSLNIYLRHLQKGIQSQYT